METANDKVNQINQTNSTNTPATAGGYKGGKGGSNTRGGGGSHGGRRGSSFGRPKPEFDQKIMNIRRVTRVVAGGRRFSFSVAIVIGDKKGSVGLGLGKAGDTSLAINKALRNAKKNMVKLKLTKTMSIPHEVKAKFSSALVQLMPNKGRGLVAGSVVRDIAKLAGMRDITGKILSKSKNKLNNAKAVMEALKPFSSKHSKPLPDAVVIAGKEEIIVPESTEVVK